MFQLTEREKVEEEVVEVVTNRHHLRALKFSHLFLLEKACPQ
jgi:hypothetical protein